MTRKRVSFDVNPLLSGPSLESRARSGSPFRFIPIADIDVDPDQPRRVFDQDALEQLSESIKAFGVLSPILVRVAGGGTYRLVAGERRLRACKLLGLDAVPAVIDTDDETEEATLSKQLVENIQREDLSPMERALAIGQLKERFSLSIRDIARRLGVSKSQIQRSLEVLALPDDLQAALIAGAPESKILMLKEVEDRELRKKLVEELDSLARGPLEERIAELSGGTIDKVSHGGTATKRIRKRELSVEDQRLVSDMQQSLGTKIQLIRDKRKPERGRVVMDFFSDEALEDIYDRLTKD